MRVAVLAAAVALLGIALAAPAWAEGPALLERQPTFAPTGAPCGPCATYTAARPLAEASEKPWRVTIAGYMWASSISGSSWEEGVESDVDIAFEDLFDQLEYAFQGVVEVEWKRWSLSIDSSFVGLEQDGPVLGGRVPTTLSLDETILDVRLGYTILCREIGKDRWGSCCYPRHYKLDLHLGARYWNDDYELKPNSAGTVAAALPSITNTVSWWDPYVGLRVRWPFAKRWFFNLYGDIGGFSIGDASELTWQVQALLGFRITRWLWVGVGYRALDVDHVEGSGVEKEGEDLLYHGPGAVIGVTF